jgi:hypothetical protein
MRTSFQTRSTIPSTVHKKAYKAPLLPRFTLSFVPSSKPPSSITTLFYHYTHLKSLFSRLSALPSATSLPCVSHLSPFLPWPAHRPLPLQSSATKPALWRSATRTWRVSGNPPKEGEPEEKPEENPKEEKPKVPEKKPEPPKIELPKFELPKKPEEKPEEKEEKPPVKDEEKPPVKDEEKPPVKDEEKPPVKDEEKPPVKDEEKPPAKDEEKPPAKDEKPKEWKPVFTLPKLWKGY